MSATRSQPRIVVVGLGPAGPEYVGEAAKVALSTSARAFLRTVRHPAAASFPGAVPLDHHYEQSSTFDEVYRAIVDELVTAAFDVVARARPGASAFVAYAVPGSPSVAEQTVSLLRSHDRATDGSMVVEVVPALSFLDLAWARLGVDPLDAGVRLIDATVFASEGAGGRGPLLVAQCWSKGVLSDVKLTIEPQAGTTATVLHHLGLPDELVSVVAWDDLDRVVEPDHLTSLWIPRLPGSPSVEIVRLRDRVRVLRGRIAANE